MRTALRDPRWYTLKAMDYIGGPEAARLVNSADLKGEDAGPRRLAGRIAKPANRARLRSPSTNPSRCASTGHDARAGHRSGRDQSRILTVPPPTFMRKSSVANATR